jgi:hypothetical protein
VSYDVEITGYVKVKCIKKLKSVKAKELMLWPPPSTRSASTSRAHRQDPLRSRASPASPRRSPVEAFAAGQ